MKLLIYDKNKWITVAETEEEITPVQFMQISKVLHSDMNMLAAGLAVLKIMSGVSWFKFKCIPADAKLICMDHVQWILKEWSPTHQLLPVYKKFYGPADELDNLTLSEFYFCEKYYNDYVCGEGGDRPLALNNLVAVLYRAAKPGYDIKKNLEGDIRIPFNGNAVAWYSIMIGRWPLHTRQAVLLYYDGCRKNLAKLYPEIFPQQSVADNDDNDSDMFGIIRGLAGGKYGDFEKTEQLPLHTALRELQYILAEEEKIKASTPAT